MRTVLRRRNQAAGLCVLLLVGIGWWGHHQSVDYTLFSPGPTINVLGKGTKQGHIISVRGHRTYRDGGQLRLVTVYETGVDERVGLFQALLGWADPKVSVYPHDVVYPQEETSTSVKQQSAAEMASSQDTATAAALRALGVKFRSAVKVVTVSKGSPAAGSLRAGDVITSFDGHPTTSTRALVRRVQSVAPKSRVRLTVQRGNKDRTIRLVTAALGKKGKKAHQSRIGVGIAPSFRFPFDIRVHLSQDFGGPSAGMMFALGIYDTLTKGSLTHGRVIAGTGTIDGHGRVGEIGGVQQKIAAAQRDGAHLFLVPSGNCPQALGADYDPDRLRLVRVNTFAQALSAVRAWAKDPSAKLPSCHAAPAGKGAADG